MFVRCLEVSSRFRQLYHRLRDSQTYFDPDPQQTIGSTHGGGKNPHRSRSVLLCFFKHSPGTCARDFAPYTLQTVHLQRHVFENCSMTL